MEGKEKKIVDFDLTPEYFSRNNIYPQYFKLPLLTLEQYEKISSFIPQKIEENYKAIDPKYLTKLSFKYEDKVEKVRKGIKINQEFFNKIASQYHDQFAKVEVSPDSLKTYISQEEKFLLGVFLFMIIRDWTEEGKEEREVSYGEILKELKKYYNYEDKSLMEKGIKILLPGARFGRFAYELGKVGYNVELTETFYCYLMILDYLFNKSGKNENFICPRIHSFCSSFTEQSVTRSYSFPDVDIKSDLANMKPNSITVIKSKMDQYYKGKKDLFDAVITIFSTDEFKNIVEAIEVIHDILKTGGIWINFGSLTNLYSSYGGFVLTWDELRQVILNYNFELKREDTPVIPYLKIEGYSLPHTCGIVFFTAIKK